MPSSPKVVARVARYAWVLLAGVMPMSYPRAQTPPAAGSDSAATLRLHGIVEPVNSHPVTAPRLTGTGPAPGGGGGPGAGPTPLVVVELARAGTHVRRGDLLVEFDRTAQIKAARDREAEYRDLLAQMDKKRAEQSIARAERRRDLALAENAARRAELDVEGNELLAAIEAEKNVLALEEAKARLDALRKTADLHARAAAADLRILEIQRERAMSAWQHAQQNARKMRIVAPIDGLVVLKTIWKSGTMAEIQEGEEVRQGITILEVVDPSAMRVRALVNQADVSKLTSGQQARVTLDSQPDRHFNARLSHVSPIAARSALNARVRTFLASFTIEGPAGASRSMRGGVASGVPAARRLRGGVGAEREDDFLLPDLAAAIDVILGDRHRASAARP